MKKLILAILSTSILAGCGDGSFNNSVTPEPTTQWADYTQESNGITYHKYDKELSGERAITTDCFFKLKSHLEGGNEEIDITWGAICAPYFICGLHMQHRRYWQKLYRNNSLP
ncbi:MULTISPECIES: hypothetical protein [Vibrio]|jgi:hypothetical protein|uniref:DUF2799 domain-containing protein n=1 Tax=Vibrio mediterranei TaxID=689 RepID=A0ABX5DEL1_9VIBR|nr:MULTISPECIES: hypothetical protein [Vibrio]MCF4175382.1 hypothetical protein [Vibrio sp. McD22-P3]PCD85681.1 hypothetical protein COR52_25530 [Vibrio mediterranei]PRQ66905.1 hypothetical protein COR51_14105 [Vibrio mediterranei]SBO09882.1 hypothetical protein VME0621_01985 [Vibrio mediterranei]